MISHVISPWPRWNSSDLAAFPISGEHALLLPTPSGGDGSGACRRGRPCFCLGGWLRWIVSSQKNRSGFYELLRDFCTFAKRYRSYIPKILALRGVHLHAVFNIIRLPKSLVVALEKSTFVYASSLRFARNACKGIDMIPAVFWCVGDETIGDSPWVWWPQSPKGR